MYIISTPKVIQSLSPCSVPTGTLYGERIPGMYTHRGLLYIIQSDLVYPDSLAPIKTCSDCETCGLLTQCKEKLIDEVTRNCVRIVRHTD